MPMTAPSARTSWRESWTYRHPAWTTTFECWGSTGSRSRLGGRSTPPQPVINPSFPRTGGSGHRSQRLGPRTRLPGQERSGRDEGLPQGSAWSQASTTATSRSPQGWRDPGPVGQGASGCLPANADRRFASFCAPLEAMAQWPGRRPPTQFLVRKHKGLLIWYCLISQLSRNVVDSTV
jgi:hypothetical protein